MKAWDRKTRVPGGKFLKGFTSSELRERLSQQRVGRKKCPVIHQPVAKAAVITSCGDWGFRLHDPRHLAGKRTVEVGSEGSEAFVTILWESQRREKNEDV